MIEYILPTLIKIHFEDEKKRKQERRNEPDSMDIPTRTFLTNFEVITKELIGFPRDLFMRRNRSLVKIIIYVSTKKRDDK
jgi:hypothetical protein